MINLFIQARMSSRRFPGKMMAMLHGQPLIDHVVNRCAQAQHIDHVIVLTSQEASDDVLAQHLENQGVRVFRGVLDPVFERFKAALTAYPCQYFVRISGDSPLIEPALISEMAGQAINGRYDFLSNVYHRKFPKGQSIEVIKSSIFNNLNADTLTSEQAEHVMPYFYENSENYKTFWLDNPQNCRHINCCVDTPDDLKNIQAGHIEYLYQAGEQICQAA